MKYFFQFGIICGFLFLGKFISPYLPFPLPGSIIGMLLLLLALSLKVVKLEWVEECSNFFFKYMAFFFVPSGVALMNSLGIIKLNIVPFLVIGILSTIIVQAITGVILQKVLGGKNE